MYIGMNCKKYITDQTFPRNMHYIKKDYGVQMTSCPHLKTTLRAFILPPNAFWSWSAKIIIDKEGYFNWFKDWTLPPPPPHTQTPHWLGCKESRSYLGVIKLTIFIKTVFCSLLLIVHLCRMYTKVYLKLFSFSLLTNLLPPPFFY